jgi:hypothetical protein
LIDRSQLLQFQAEQVIYEQEAIPNKQYLIVSGSVSLIKKKTANTIPGEKLHGEISLPWRS